MLLLGSRRSSEEVAVRCVRNIDGMRGGHGDRNDPRGCQTGRVMRERMPARVSSACRAMVW